jgi:hypothetical protein
MDSTHSSFWVLGRFGGIVTIMFNVSSPHLSTALTMARDEAWSWSMTGAKGITLLARQILEMYR